MHNARRPSVRAVMNERFIHPGERILREAGGIVWLRSWFRSRRGRLVLTSERLLLEVPREPFARRSAFTPPYEPSIPVEIPRPRIVASLRSHSHYAELHETLWNLIRSDVEGEAA